MSPALFTPEKECYSVLFLQFFRMALPRPTAKTTRGGERGLFRLHFPASPLLLGAASAKTSLSNPRGKEKVRFLRWRLPYSCSQRPKMRELSPAARAVPAPPQRLVAPVPWNLTPAYFQGNQVESMPPPQACLPVFVPDPRPVTKVPNAPVSNSLGLKKLGGGVTCVEDPTGSPPKVATACKANITTAKAISLFIFVLDSIPEREQRKAWEQ
jgi:hypothetical protein